MKKTVTNDRSAPILSKEGGSSGGGPVPGAPPVPTMGRPPAAPPVPGSAGNRLRSGSETSSGVDSGPSAPAAQLGGLFVGGMPKLRSRGGVDTGANKDSPYYSESDSSAPKPPIASAPKPPTAPRPPGARPPPPPPSTESPPAPNPLVAALRKPPPRPASRPSSAVSSRTAPDTPPPRAPLPLPGSSKPPPPPVSPRKPSTPALPPPPPPSSSPAAPPPPPPAASAPRPPPAPARSTPPPPPSAPSQNTNGAGAASIAVQAARNALGHKESAPAAPPPPPPASLAPAAPPPPPPVSPPSAPSPALPRAPAQETQPDSSAYTLSNGGPSLGASGGHGIVPVEDNRFKFQNEGLFPKPRPFTREVRRYRAGRGSSVPLDLSALSG